MRALLQHTQVAWRSGLRSRSFQAIFFLGLLAMGAAYLAAQFSGRQPATVALDVGISAIRLIGLLLVLFWCQEFLGKEVDRRTIFVSLSYPVPRSTFLLGRFIGLIALTVLAVALLGLLLLITVNLSGDGYEQSTPVDLGAPFILTLLYIALDLSVIASFGVLVSAVSTTPLLPLALGFAFAVAARSLGPVIDFLLSEGQTAREMRAMYGSMIDVVRWVVPDLSRLDIRSVALYGKWPEELFLLPSAAMAVAYIGALMCLAVILFSRRQFN